MRVLGLTRLRALRDFRPERKDEMSITKRNFKVENLPAGPKKAFRRFHATYGKEEGERIFLKKADEQGRGRTLREKVIDVYRKRG